MVTKRESLGEGYNIGGVELPRGLNWGKICTDDFGRWVSSVEGLVFTSIIPILRSTEVGNGESLRACLLSGIDGPYTSSCPYVKDLLRVWVNWGEVEHIVQRNQVNMVYDIKSVYCLARMSIR